MTHKSHTYSVWTAQSKSDGERRRGRVRMDESEGGKGGKERRVRKKEENED